MINQNTSLQDYQTIMELTTITDIPRKPSPEKLKELGDKWERYARALNEFDHLKAINSLRNENAQAYDLLILILYGQSIYSKNFLAGYGFSNWGGTVSVTTRSPRTNCLTSLDLNMSNIRNFQKVMGISTNDNPNITLGEALIKIKDYCHANPNVLMHLTPSVEYAADHMYHIYC